MTRDTAPIGAERIVMSDETTTEATEATETKPARKVGPPENWTPAPTATHRSLAAYVTEHSGIEITDDQASALLIFHKYWQADPARKAERDAEKQAKAEEAEAKKAAREEEKARKAAEREEAKRRKEEKAKAKAAAEADDDSDLDDADDADDLDLDAEEAPKPKRRRRKAAPSADED